MFGPFHYFRELTDELVNKIANCNRCEKCSNLDKRCIRYKCGHTSCSNCFAESCSFCMKLSLLSKPTFDETLLNRAKNSLNLLKSYQDVITTIDNTQTRKSKQLEIEKQVFPSCIQAPVKYFNKRKSRCLSSKENFDNFSLPGEHIASSKMNDSIRNVHEWLNKHENQKRVLKRKPFTDLDLNSPNAFNKSNNFNKLNECDIEKEYTYTTSPVSPFKRYSIPVSKNESKEQIKNKTEDKNAKCVCDESGIDIDDGSIIMIESTQSDSLDNTLIDDTKCQITDKDKLALLAVIEADKNLKTKLNDSQTKSVNKTNIIQNKLLPEQTSLRYNKVPFYKKSKLNVICNASPISKNSNIFKENTKDLSITVESDSIITNIKLTTIGNNKSKYKQSTSVQTDPIQPGKVSTAVNCSSKPSEDDEDKILSQDIFANDCMDVVDELKSKECSNNDSLKTVLILDSDSDDELQSSVLQAIADVHRSCDENDYGVLSELAKRKQNVRPKRRPRGHTPVSTDSSDKENRDPNRMKIRKSHKKKSRQKKNINK